jgi:hypothetical protein
MSLLPLPCFPGTVTLLRRLVVIRGIIRLPLVRVTVTDAARQDRYSECTQNNCHLRFHPGHVDSSVIVVSDVQPPLLWQWPPPKLPSVLFGYLHHRIPTKFEGREWQSRGPDKDISGPIQRRYPDFHCSIWVIKLGAFSVYCSRG